MLSPASQKVIDLFASAGAPPLPEGTVETARKSFEGLIDLLGPGPGLLDVRDLTIPGPAGPIPARVYAPSVEPLATIVYYRGGGWVVGSLDATDAFARTLARASNSVVVAIDYRRAPEHVFPAAVDDSMAGLRWAADAFDSPLIVCGDSAGGNLAAVCALKAKQEGGPALTLQVLIYPVADHTFDQPSYVEHGHSGLLVGEAEMRWFWDHYLPDLSRRRHPDASPLRARSFAGLPQAYIVVVEYDPLRDGAQELARRMSMDGVDVTVRYYHDEFHGFATMVNYLAAADAAVADIGRFVQEVLGRE
jgi:acetyl esterase